MTFREAEVELARQAIKTRGEAYAPYSKFQVGAAIRCEDGRIFTGANVENASYGLTICAERSAVVAAVSNGARRFESIAIAAIPRTSPCGACRQFLAEWSLELRVILVDPDSPDDLEAITLKELLPRAFRLRSI